MKKIVLLIVVIPGLCKAMDPEDAKKQVLRCQTPNTLRFVSNQLNDLEGRLQSIGSQAPTLSSEDEQGGIIAYAELQEELSEIAQQINSIKRIVGDMVSPLIVTHKKVVMKVNQLFAGLKHLQRCITPQSPTYLAKLKQMRLTSQPIARAASAMPASSSSAASTSSAAMLSRNSSYAQLDNEFCDEGLINFGTYVPSTAVHTTATRPVPQKNNQANNNSNSNKG